MNKILLSLFVASASTLFAVDGAEIYKAKCFSCHGEKASKAALNKSQIIAGWDADKIITSVNGYKNGAGGAMKNVMKPIASGLNDDDLKAVATTIASFK
ncbi:c-type cytochrome [Sulfurospirillum diekertiae]|uniref:C-type cytochrome n=1 Tax=Sulfurospirillum diekertiae TaxID=1854492 RepID=A0A6G9VRA3_9BACT|nr:c-type cytochrome [Sulfurospirillum diekertiae]QIR75889.1 c-type cytochrome [Sulfurospirillum diekertiae]QIR78529.1 c-type cytochrome [Sulfurospirillum diekertiae]